MTLALLRLLAVLDVLSASTRLARVILLDALNFFNVLAVSGAFFFIDLTYVWQFPAKNQQGPVGNLF